MSKRKNKTDVNTLDLPFGRKIYEYEEKWTDIRESITASTGARTSHKENEFELSIEIAAGIKKAIRESGKSREEIVDAVNAYFGRSKSAAKEAVPECRNPLTIHMLNNYISKSTDTPIPSYYLTAIVAVTKSYAPVQALVEPFGARVCTAEELKMQALGNLEVMKEKMAALRKELKKGVS